MFGLKFPTRRPPVPTEIDLGDRTVPLVMRTSPRSTRLSMRFDALNDALVVVRPPRVPEREALAFVRERMDWIRGRLAAHPPRVSFAAGAEVPLLGVPHVVRHLPDARRGVWVEDGEIRVSGQDEHVSRRVSDFLQKRARAEIVPRAHRYAELLDRKVGRISMRDPRTRWGSCTSRGDLSFSWRLVLAPDDVLDYVVAHEAAHLVELNHSHRFWAIVRTLVGDSAGQRRWLKENGARLHRYG